MKLKRNTGLVLSLVLILAPATAAVAKPVASHHLAVDTSSFESGVSVNGSIDLTVDGSGISSVRLIWAESSLTECGATSGLLHRSIEHAGPAALDVTIDRHLETVVVTGSLEVVETVTTCGSSVVSSSTIDLNLTGVAADRPARSRDGATGTRFISRAHEFVLELGVKQVLDSGTLTKSISSS
ncbi:MAG: hypothetical protein OEQ47_02185 [Acidimicrobiia bacterium]|nr:hypothetical protein [Acidimicrobiia bacterium]